MLGVSFHFTASHSPCIVVSPLESKSSISLFSNSADNVGGGDIRGVQVGADTPGVGDAGADNSGTGGAGEARGPRLVRNDKIWEGDGGEKTVGTDMVIATRTGCRSYLNFHGGNDTVCDE